MKSMILFAILIVQSTAFPSPGSGQKYPKKYNKLIDGINQKSKTKETLKSSYEHYKVAAKLSALRPPSSIVYAPETSSDLLTQYPSSYVSVYEKRVSMPPRHLVPPPRDSYSAYTETAAEDVMPPTKEVYGSTDAYTGYTGETGEKSDVLEVPELSSYSKIPGNSDKTSVKTIPDAVRGADFVDIKPPTREFSEEPLSSSYASYSPAKSSYVSYE